MRYSLWLAALVCVVGWFANLQLGGAQEPSDTVKPAAQTEKEDSNGAATKAKDPAAKKAKQGDQKKLQVASLTLDSSFPEGAGQGGLFAEIQPSLHQIIERIEKAGKDDQIAALVLKLRSPAIGRGKVDELRAAVARFRKTGKKVYADMQMAEGPDYLIAAACNEIAMPSSGVVAVAGVRAEVTFFKDLLDKVGVEAQLMQVGDFKGAAEPFTRSEMSPEFRQQFESVLDDYYTQLVEIIAADRKLDAAKVRELIDQGIFTAEGAKAAGLIDTVAYEDEFNARLKQQLKADEVEIIKDYGKKKIDTDFSGLTGMIKLMELMMGGDGDATSAKTKKVAVVYAVGMIMPGDSSSGLFAQTLGCDTIIKALRQAEKDEKVVAIVLRVDSPGGSALASDLIWREITRIEKPIIASMGDVAASGGYYISMGADKIFAEPGTLTGSIGVVGGKMVIKGLYEKLGVKMQVISRGKNSGWMSPSEPFSDSEREAWTKMMADIYRQFTTKAAEGRKMPVEDLQKLAQGKVYSGSMAVENKLVDKLGTLADAVAEAKQLAGVSAAEKIDLLILPEPKSFFEELFGGPDLQTELESAAPEVFARVRETMGFRRLLHEPVLTVMPYRVDVR